MIARLRGRLDSVSADHAVIDVNGVGYLVAASTRTLGDLGAIGEEVAVHTEMLVSEDSIRLVAFGSAAERDWFRLLVGVQGIGARVALAILSTLSADELHKAVASGEHRLIARAPGVGPKIAQRAVNELRDKIGAIALGPAAVGATPRTSLAQDAVSALINLGFRPGEAAQAVAQAETELGPEASLDALVRTALKKAAR